MMTVGTQETFVRHPRPLASLIAVALLFALLVPGTSAFAGTTGSLSGSIVDATTHQPLAGASVTVASPSQTATTTTDGGGSFTFLSLAPDTYALTAVKAGYQNVAGSGITINADQSLRLDYTAVKTLQTIGNVRSRASSSLVRAGTVTDTYSVNAATQERIAGLGGGGSLNQAYSALAATPGVFVPSGQNGWSQMAGVVIRGGTHSQIGYEFDGIPVNVGVNGFPGNNLSTLGQQEAQVYAGSAPANSESQGLSGFINQVIKTGTAPGSITFDGGLGTPVFYHKGSFEVSGASKDRSISYYAGTLGANQAFRLVDNFNGASYTSRYGYGYDVLPCGANAAYAACYNAGNGLFTPGGLQVGADGFRLAPVNYLAPAYNQDRETIVNLHFGIPHKKDGARDDVQLLYQTGNIASSIYDSANDLGVAPYPFATGNIYTGAVGTLLPANYQSLVQPYYFPGVRFGTIPASLRDLQQNGQTIAKVQYQHNFGSSAYLRVYGYSLYSYFLFDAPNGTSSPASGFLGEPPDYKLWTHTSGYSAEFADQITSKHLIQAQASYGHAPSVRDNNTAWATGKGAPFAYAVDSTNPTSGVCYNVASGAGLVAAPVPCARGVSTNVTYGNAAAPPALTGYTCGSGPCAYYVADNGNSGAFNTVVLNTTAGSLSDQWKPTDRLTLDFGARYHQYRVVGADTTGGARTFWFNAYNTAYCVNSAPGNTPFRKSNINLPCSSFNVGNQTFVSPNMTNAPANYTFTEWEPRIGATFTVDPNTVLRASYGKYSQPPPTAFQQYNTHQQNLPAYLAQRFYKYGYTGSGHNIPPQESYNTDLSLEHALHGTDISFKLTPFYRTTKNELTEFFIDPVNQLTSGLPVGSLTSKGLEFQLRKGAFERDGLSALFSYTYTDARIKYYKLPGGGSILSPINNDIQSYNAYTSFCASNASDPRCGVTSSGAVAAPCYSAAGNGGTCGTLDAGGKPINVANPYWNAPVQSLFDPSASYWPTDPVVATTGLGINGYTVPHVLTLVLNYRKHGFAITPSLQLQAGQRYGAPEANAGIDPAGGCGTLASSVTGDPRYPYGAVGGSPFDATTCTAALNAIPNTFTRKFDDIGAFRSPTQLLGSLTMSYDFNKRAGVTVTMANIINQCFGGSQTAWTGAATPHVCSYISGEISRINAPVGNAYNPGSTFQNVAQYPYTPYLGAYTMGVVNPSAPFAVYADFHIKI